MDIPKGPFCQSCAMPMEKPEHFGTEAGGSQSQDYCCHCYQEGKFVNPEMTMEEMIVFVEKQMRDMNAPDAVIIQTRQFIPSLKRWRT
jgi:hypothetical protein